MEQVFKGITSFILGNGNIGKPLFNQYVSLGASAYKFGRISFPEFKRQVESHKPDIVNFAFPSDEDGKIAREFALIALRFGVKAIVTAEKSLTAYQRNMFSEKEWRRIGNNASVGGSLRAIEKMKDHLSLSPKFEMTAILNASLNFIWSEVSNGRQLLDVMHEAEMLKILEPSMQGTDLKILIEFDDLIKKACCLWNSALLAYGKPITPDDFKVEEWTSGFKEYLTPETRWRPIVSIHPLGKQRSGTIIPFATHINGEYEIAIELQKSPSIFDGGNGCRGTNNAIKLWHELLTGVQSHFWKAPGAGPDQTVSAMLIDAAKILKLK